MTDSNDPPWYPTVEEMTLLGEARNQGPEGMIAVAEVLRNRAKYRGMTTEAVALQPKQFSFWNDEKGQPVDSGLQRGMRVAWENENMWPSARQSWDTSANTNTVLGADMYHANYVKPPWDMNKVKKLIQIGDHIFYREIK